MGVTHRDSADSENRTPDYACAPQGLILSGDPVQTRLRTPVQADAAPITPPWNWDFSGSDPLAGFTVLNILNDTWTWGVDASMGEHASISGSARGYDDWLITPPITLEKGKAYEFSLDAFTGLTIAGMVIPGDGPERLEILWGTAPTVEAMVNVVAEPVSFTDSKTITGHVVPAADGPVYIGIHAVEEESSFYLNVDNLHLRAGRSATRPGKVTDFSVVPDAECGPEVKISFAAPTLDMNGDPLSGPLTKVEIYRDGESVHTALSPEAGARIDFTDTLVPTGERTYTVTAYNEAGEGETVEATVYAGPRVPALPGGILLEETAEDGTLSLGWDIVSDDGLGNYINPDMITYNVHMLNIAEERILVSEDALPGIEFETMFRDQQMVRATVAAVSEAGTSGEAMSNIVIAGPAYDAPFGESFEGARTHHPILTSTVEGEAEWYTMSEDAGIPSQDGDGGFMVMMSDPGASAEIILPKVNLHGLQNPCLTFWTYNIARMAGYPDKNELAAAVRVTGGEFKEVKRVVMDDLGEKEGWYRVIVPLHEYAGQKVTVRFTGKGCGMTYTLLDNVSIDSMETHDLSAGSVSVPERTLRPGESFTASVTVENLGYADASGYDVILYCNGEKVAQKAGAPVASGTQTATDFHLVVSPLCETDLTYHATVEYAADEWLENNATSKKTVAVALSGLPAVTGLAAESEGASVSLSWASPDLTRPASDFVFEDFEKYTPWTSAGIGEWKFIDMDMGYIGGIAGLPLPGIPEHSQQSWFVMDATDFDPTQFHAHSGYRYIGQMYVYPSETGYVTSTCDDWAVSPELDGEEQTVSFWARSLTSDARDQFEVLVSSAGTDPADFTAIATVESAPASWKLYEYELPEGTRHFAIRSRSDSGFMLLVDDISFVRAVAPAELDLLGYNVYRDGERLNNSPVTETSCAVPAPDGDSEEHDWAVTAVYRDLGESRAARTSTQGGVDSATAAALKVSAGAGRVTVTGAREAISVVTPDGRTAARSEAAPAVTFELEPGVYLVKTGSRTFKVMVGR